MRHLFLVSKRCLDCGVTQEQLVGDPWVGCALVPSLGEAIGSFWCEVVDTAVHWLEMTALGAGFVILAPWVAVERALRRR